MYEINRRFNFSDGNIMSDTYKCDLPQEALQWINMAVGYYRVSEKNKNRILDMSPGEKVKFKMGDCTVSVKCK